MQPKERRRGTLEANLCWPLRTIGDDCKDDGCDEERGEVDCAAIREANGRDSSVNRALVLAEK